jgi:hypothetical protein
MLITKYPKPCDHANEHIIIIYHHTIIIQRMLSSHPPTHKVLSTRYTVFTFFDTLAWPDGQTDTELKADFHSVQNVARSTFNVCFLLKYKHSSGTNLISYSWLHTFRKKAIANNRSRDILNWMEIRLNVASERRKVSNNYYICVVFPEKKTFILLWSQYVDKNVLF